MYRKIEDFLQSYEVLMGGTGHLLATLTDENMGQAVAEGHRTLGQIAWHIVATIPEMMNRTGLGIASVDPQAPPPDKAAEMADAYGRVSGELRDAIRGGWKDETLSETDDMYGESWPRGKSLAALVSHEVHHRGQMTVLLRQAGVKVPGLFGPAKEEWGQYGMKEPPY